MPLKKKHNRSDFELGIDKTAKKEARTHTHTYIYTNLPELCKSGVSLPPSRFKKIKKHT